MNKCMNYKTGSKDGRQSLIVSFQSGKGSKTFKNALVSFY
jgi:hypothetical protein